MDDKEKKLKFVLAMTKHGLQHFDGGGVISAGNSNPLSGLAGALTAQNTYQATGPDMNQVVSSQNALGSQLATEGAGGGSNPAQIQYQQNAQQIAQQQAALNANNRALNPGLAARQSSNAAVQAGGAAASGAAIQQAQQQLTAQEQLNQLLAQEQNASISGQGINAQVGQNNANAVNNTQGGILKGVTSSIPVLDGLFADGGEVKKMASGGSINVSGVPSFSNASTLPDMSSKKSPNTLAPSVPSPFDGMADSNFWAADFSMPELGSSAGIGSSAAAPSLLEAAPLAAALSKGGPVSHAGKWLKNESLMKGGGPVKASSPKEKAVVQGDSIKNDKVPAMLSEGEVVIDRNTMKDPGPVGQMARALAKHIQARNGKKA